MKQNSCHRSHAFLVSTQRVGTSKNAMRGVTLIELSVVLLILVALAGVTLPMLTQTVDNAECSLTDTTLQNIKSAILGTSGSPGFIGDMNRMPYNLGELITCPITGTFACATHKTSSYSPSSHSGWRGPYLSNGILDQFKSPTNSQGSPIQLVIEYNGAIRDCNYFLLSYGSDGTAQTPLLTISDTSDIYTSCPNISSSTMSNFIGVSYLDTTVYPTWSRGDDRLLFIESVDPGVNTPCNQ